MVSVFVSVNVQRCVSALGCHTEIGECVKESDGNLKNLKISKWGF